MTTLCSYDLNGKKLSFANWVSNLSPQETPFTSMTGKESIKQTLFQWQTDYLAPAMKNAQKEGTVATEEYLRTTKTISNLTQIMRKTVKVSDTANALANYGRGKELQYQMEKAGKELKRDVEFAFLNNGNSQEEFSDSANNVHPRKTAGFQSLCADMNTPDVDTGAIVHFHTATKNQLKEADIYLMTYNLYLAGSDADIIMYHPKWASVFSALQEATGGDNNRLRIFENTPKYSVYVSTIVDPLGQEYKLIPNRWMPEGEIYFFNPKNWTQMVLRSPARTKLAKDGSYEKWMIEMEVGLRHKHPYSSGVLNVVQDDDPASAGAWGEKTDVELVLASAADNAMTKTKLDGTAAHLQVKAGKSITFHGQLKFVKGDVAKEVYGSSAKQVATKPYITMPDGTGYEVTTNDQFHIVKEGATQGHWTLKAADIATVGGAAGIAEVAAEAEGGDGVTQPVAARDLLLTSSAYSNHNGEWHIELRSASLGYKAVARSASVTLEVR